MAKAFLSHSSYDKEFVRKVANLLGRHHCIFDERTFDIGEEFKAEIERALNDSYVFVFFASKASLDSVWVQFELKEAWYHSLQGTLKKSLVYVLDNGITIDDLPDWMRRFRVRWNFSEEMVFEDIRQQLHELSSEEIRSIFIGRFEESAEFQRVLLSYDDPQRVFFVTGLPGIGRRSLIKNVVRDSLGLKIAMEFKVGEGDSLNEICVKLAAHVEPGIPDEGFKNLVNKIRALSEDEAIVRTLEYLRNMEAAGELPIFLDSGGLLTNRGYLQQPIWDLLMALSPYDDIYLFFVLERKPQFPPDTFFQVFSLKPLETPYVRQLVGKLAARDKVQLSDDYIARIADVVSGFPYAARIAISLVKERGIADVLKLGNPILDYRYHVFARHLSKLAFTEVGRQLLVILAEYSPLPDSVIISIFSDVPLVELREALNSLTDFALVIADTDYYWLADPISGVIQRFWETLTQEQHKVVAYALDNFLSSEDAAWVQGYHRLECYRSMFIAAELIGDNEIKERAIFFVNDLITLTEKMYHERRFDEAIRIGQAALAEYPESQTALSYLIRALIQLGRYEEAEKNLEELKRHAPKRDVLFLKGFLLRKRQETSRALEVYKEAYYDGKEGVAISRELALCYYLLGDQEQAMRFVKEGLSRYGDNEYIVDLWVQIALRKRDEEDALKAMEILRLISEGSYYYHHRASRVALSFGNIERAHEEAEIAVSQVNELISKRKGFSPPSEVIVQLVHCKIKLGDPDNLDQAEDILISLDKAGENIHDVRIGLWCQLEITRGDFRGAYKKLKDIRDKHTIFYLKLKRDALLGLVSLPDMPPSKREDFKRDISYLETRLQGARPEEFIPAEINIYDFLL